MARIRTMAAQFDRFGAMGHLPRLDGWVGADDYYTPRREGWLPEEERKWWIYFIQGDDGGPIKIGKSRRPKWRVSELQIGYPFGTLAVCAMFRGVAAHEREMHVRWADLALRGEWFQPGPDLCSFILSLPEPS